LHRPTVTSSASYGDHQTSTQLGINGGLGDSNKINYNAYDNNTSSTSPTASSNTVGVGGQYAGSYGQVWGSYSSGATRQSTVNVSGAVLGYSGGVLLAPSLGETVGIVYAPGAEGASVMNSNNNKIDSSGYSVIPFLTPYMNNEIVIDPKGSSLNVELDTTAKQVAPRAGAVVLLKFSTTIGHAVLMTVMRDDGKSIPIGASVYDEKGKEIGMLAQGGKFFNRSLGNSGKLTVKWGETQQQQCRASYTVPSETKQQSEDPYQQVEVQCAVGLEVATIK
jgi:outer membrane usher protein